MSEFIEGSPIAFWSGALAILILVLLVWGRAWRWPAILREQSASATREIARSRGIRVDDVERTVPFLERRVRFERERVTRYSIPRAVGATPPRWSFVQRTKKLGAQYPHGWVFRAEAPPTVALDEILRRIARTRSEDFLEFEADESEVHAFWHEGGGAEDVDDLEKLLRALAAIGRDAAGPGLADGTPAPQSPSAADEEVLGGKRAVSLRSRNAPWPVRLAMAAAWFLWLYLYVNWLMRPTADFLSRFVPRDAALFIAALGLAAPWSLEWVSKRVAIPSRRRS